MKISTAESICETLADYREGDIPRRSPKDVRRWLDQFDAADRPIILEETDRILKQFYIGKEQAAKFIEAIWKTKELAGETPKATIKNYKFLDIQRHGDSQKA